MRSSRIYRGTLLISLVTVFIALPISVSAKVSLKTCDNCHTMHNSQDGEADTLDSNATPNDGLVKGTCAGCHAQHTGNNVVVLGDAHIPQVYHTNATDLAGGNFAFIDGTKGDVASAAKGHNVYAAISALGSDGSLSTPPGDEFSTGVTNNNFTCGGQFGCHGDRSNTSSEFSAIKGAHHADDSTTDGTTVGTSYRFLKGVKGVENNDPAYGWQNDSGTYCNKYKGVNGPDADASKTSPGTNGTISGFCSECHGKSHGSGANGHGTSSAWKRHPVDILLPNSGCFAAYNPVTSYDATVPVAYTNPASPTRATSVVSCLSCHAAHGTNYSDMMRWDKATETGCIKCHSNR